MLVASIDPPVLAIKFLDPLSFPLFDVQCVTSFNFLQDGNREIFDAMISLGEVLACGSADITILDFSVSPRPHFFGFSGLGLKGLGLRVWGQGLRKTISILN